MPVVGPVAIYGMNTFIQLMNTLYALDISFKWQIAQCHLSLVSQYFHIQTVAVPIRLCSNMHRYIYVQAEYVRMEQDEQLCWQSVCLEYIRVWVPAHLKLGTMAQTYNPSSWQVETGDKRCKIVFTYISSLRPSLITWDPSSVFKRQIDRCS